MKKKYKLEWKRLKSNMVPSKLKEPIDDDDDSRYTPSYIDDYDDKDTKKADPLNNIYKMMQTLYNKGMKYIKQAMMI